MNSAIASISGEGNSGGPLQGVRIVEMGQLIAIPFAMKLLADMGAEVIRLESTRRLESYRGDSVYLNEIDGEFWNRGANFYEQNRNKLGITRDLGLPEGLEVLRRLIGISDVFAENFTPRVIRNFGLEYQDLRRIKPDIIMVSSTGYGFDGPWANFGATGPATEGASGLAYATGYADGAPVMAEIPYVDYTAGEHTVFAVMAGLMHRLRTGEGQFIDVSQAQAAAATIPEVLLDFAANGREATRMGNSDQSHGAPRLLSVPGGRPLDCRRGLHGYGMAGNVSRPGHGRLGYRPPVFGLPGAMEEPE